MPHKLWKLLLSFWATSLAIFTLAPDSNAQQTLSLEVFSPGGADGRSIATGMFFANNRLTIPLSRFQLRWRVIKIGY